MTWTSTCYPFWPRWLQIQRSRCPYHLLCILSNTTTNRHVKNFSGVRFVAHWNFQKMYQSAVCCQNTFSPYDYFGISIQPVLITWINHPQNWCMMILLLMFPPFNLDGLTLTQTYMSLLSVCPTLWGCLTNIFLLPNGTDFLWGNYLFHHGFTQV